MTADAIKAAITCDEAHINALIEYNDALYQADLCGSAVKAMDHKKTALQNLVQLCLSGYFALPKIPRDLKAEMKKISKEEQEAIEEAKKEVQEKAARRIRNKTAEEMN
jgi:translation initiation factor 2B subunit (eIF-2B alpha/beta/delta family)